MSEISSASSAAGPFITYAKTKKEKAEFKNKGERLDSPTMRAAMALEKFNQVQDNDIVDIDDDEERFVSKFHKNEDIALDLCNNLESEMNQMFRDLDDMHN